MQNAFIENFNGRFRDECLNVNWFHNLHHDRFAVSFLAVVSDLPLLLVLHIDPPVPDRSPNTSPCKQLYEA